MLSLIPQNPLNPSLIQMIRQILIVDSDSAESFESAADSNDSADSDSAMDSNDSADSIDFEYSSNGNSQLKRFIKMRGFIKSILDSFSSLNHSLK